jgi:hypothetical protein
MSITQRTLMFAVTAVLSVPFLVACDDNGGHEKAKPTVTPERDINEGVVSQSQFVKDFRAQHPNLAKGVDDDLLAEHGAATCDLFEGDDEERSDALKQVSKDFSANGIKPNDDTTILIMKLAVKDVCPERTNNLIAVL